MIVYEHLVIDNDAHRVMADEREWVNTERI